MTGETMPNDDWGSGSTAGRRRTRGTTLQRLHAPGNVAAECFTTVKPTPTATRRRIRRAARGTGDAGDGQGDGRRGVAGQPTPTGTVTFFLCQPRGRVTAGQGCVTGGTQVGVGEDTELTGQATSRRGTEATKANHDGRSGSTAGGRCTRGTASTTASTDVGNVAAECFTTVKQASQTATTSNPTGAP